MTSNGLATDLYISAYTRIASRDNVPITVLRKGDANSGAMILKINLLNGTARVLIEARFHDERVWTPATHSDPMPDRDADEYLTRQGDIDPDLWLVEIEDKQGRIWFPGKVVTL